MADPSLPPSDYLGLAAWLIGAGGGATLLAGIGKYLFGPKALEAPTPTPMPPPIDETMPTHFGSHYLLLKGDVVPSGRSGAVLSAKGEARPKEGRQTGHETFRLA